MALSQTANCVSSQQHNSCASATSKVPLSNLVRPLERKITNIMVPANPLKRQITPVTAPIAAKISNAAVKVPNVPPQNKVSIVLKLNAPFIKITSTPPKKYLLPYGLDEELKEVPVSPSKSSSTPMSSKLVETGIHLRTKRKTTGYFEEQEIKPVADRPPRPRAAVRSHRKAARSKPRSGRASYRLYQKLKKHVHKPREPTIIKASRTVELIDQSGEGWRDEKAKLLFVLGLGLSIHPKKPVPGPTLKLERIDPEIVAKIEKRYEEERIVRLEQDRVKNEMLMMDRLRQQLNNAALERLRPNAVEVIDIASEEEEDEDEDEDSIGFIIPHYPRVTIEPLFHRQETSRASNVAARLKKAAVSCVTNPRPVKRLESVVRVNRIRHLPSPSQQFMRNGLNQVRLPPKVPPSRPQRLVQMVKPQIIATPSPPMQVADMAPKIVERSLKSDPFNFQRIIPQECFVKRSNATNQKEVVIQID